MSKNEHLPTMYESIPAVAALNKVPGFDPFKLLRRTVSPNGDEVMQLDLPYKKLWFRLANPKGRIRLNALRITEQLAIFEAQVYLDRCDENPVGSFTSSCAREDAPGGQYVQAAQFEAMDQALTDAGFGLQFADVSMGAGGSRYGSRIPLAGISGTQKEGMVFRSAETAGKPVQESVQAIQASGEALPVSAGEMPPDSVQVSSPKVNGRVIAGVQEMEPVIKRAGKSSAENPVMQGSRMVQPAEAGKAMGRHTVVQNGNAQPTGNAKAAVPAMEQGQMVQHNGNVRYLQPAVTQEQGTHPSENGRNDQSVVVRAQSIQSARNAKSAQTAATQQKMQSAGNAKPDQAATVQQKIQPVGSVKTAQAAAMQVQNVQSAVNAGSFQQYAEQVQAGGDRLPVQASIAAGGTEASSVMVQRKPVLPNSLPIQSAVANGQPVRPVGAGLPIQPQAVQKESAQRAGADELPVRASEPESLPAQPKEGNAAVMAGMEMLPAGRGGEAEKIQESVQGAMALLGGQGFRTATAEAPAGNTAAASMEVSSTAKRLPVQGSQTQEGGIPSYTADMPVEEIVKLMTFEEAGRVVVDTGVCKGQTIAEVAERRPPSLKFYLYGGYKGDNNILRAAAKIMLESLAARKAG